MRKQRTDSGQIDGWQPAASSGWEPALSVLVTCYNEHQSVGSTLRDLKSALQSRLPDWEILVVDDASTDDSAAVIHTFKAENPDATVRVLERRHNRGFVANVREGALNAQGRYFWVVSGDHTVPTEAMHALLASIGRADIVIPLVERYKGRSRFRNLISTSYTRIVNLLSGQSIGYYNGGSIFLRADFAREIRDVTGFGYSAEIILRLLARGRSHVEVPVVYRESRKERSSALSWKHFTEVAAFFCRLLWLRFRGERPAG